MALQLFVALFVTVLVLYLAWALYRASYWRRHGVAGPWSFLLLGEFFDAFNPYNPFIYNVLPNYTKKYGKIWGYNEGLHRSLVVADLEIAQEVLSRRFEDFQARKVSHLLRKGRADKNMHLLDARGTRWKRLRTVASPHFSQNSLKKVATMINDSSAHFIEHLREKGEHKDINIHRFYQEMTMDVISRMAMGADRSKQWETDNVDNMKAILERDFREPFLFLTVLFPFLRPTLRKLFEIYVYLKTSPGTRIVMQIIQAVNRKKVERAVDRTETSDFIDMFVDSTDESFDISADDAFDRRELTHIVKQLTIDEAYMSCFVFIIAGYDTSANTLGNVTSYLAQMPDIQERARDEVLAVCQSEHDISFDEVSQLKFIDYIIKETLRFHPVASTVVSRMVMKDTTLAGIPLERGMSIQIDVPTIHMDPAIWGADADSFNPDRWMNPTLEQTHAFMGFGAGPRQCIGMRLAYIEMKMTLAKLLRVYRIAPARHSPARTADKWIGTFVVAPTSVDVQLQRLVSA